MAKKIRAMLKVQAPAGAATAAPPVGLAEDLGLDLSREPGVVDQKDLQRAQRHHPPGAAPRGGPRPRGILPVTRASAAMIHGGRGHVEGEPGDRER